MLSAFRAKRKSKKTAPPPRRIQPSFPHLGFSSPEVVEITDNSLTTFAISKLPAPEAASTPLKSPQVDLKFTDEPWFPSDIVKNLEAGLEAKARSHGENVAGGSQSGGSSGSTANFPEDVHSGEVGAPEDVPSISRTASNTELTSVGEEGNASPPAAARKTYKAAPAPIKIPNPRAKVQIQRSADVFDAGSGLHPPANQFCVNSPVDRDDASIISGITLPGALIGDSFSLSNQENRQSRYQRRITRQDSATLPFGENSLMHSPFDTGFRISGGEVIAPESGRGSPIPPVPPLPPHAALGLGRENEDVSVVEEADGAPDVDIKVDAAEGGSYPDKRVSRLQNQSRPPSTPPISGTPNLSKVFHAEQHAVHLISPITEALTPIATSPAQSDRSKEPVSAASSKLSTFSQQMRRAGFDDQFLSPMSHGSPSMTPQSNRSARSGEDIDQVLDEFMAGSIFGGNSPSSTGSVPTPPASGRPLPEKQVSAPSPSSRPLPTTNLEIKPSPSRSRSSSRSGLSSRPSLASVNSLMLHPSTLLPIGERPRSMQDIPFDAHDDLALLPSGILAPRSPHLSQLPDFPESANLPSASLTARSELYSPDLLDNIVLGPAPPALRPRATNSILNPITVGAESDHTAFNIGLSEDSDSASFLTPSTGSGKQTFPETPSAFSPMFSAAPGQSSAGWSPALPSGVSAVSPVTRTLSMNRVPPTKSRHSRASAKFLVRSNTHKVIVTRGRSIRAKHGKSGLASAASIKVPPSPLAGPSKSAAASPLTPTRPDGSAIGSPRHPRAESSAPSPKSHPTTAPPPVPTGSGPQASEQGGKSYAEETSAAEVRTSKQIGARALPPPRPPPLPPMPRTPTLSLPTEIPPPPQQPAPQPPAPAPTQVPAPAPAPAPAAASQDNSTTSSAAGTPPPYYSVVNRSPSVSPASTYHAQPNTTRRAPGRPPLPIGPRNRMANSSSHSHREGPGSAGSGTYTESSRRPSVASVVMSAPKFQTTPVQYKGFTMEAAKWTFTSEQLQSIVSRAIRQSSEASSIRLLPLQTLDVDLPNDRERIEKVQTELKTQYKLHVRKRNTLLASLSSHVGGREMGPNALRAVLEDLQEVSSNLDQIAEDLYSARDQAAQLDKLSVTHSASALAMALRKLNASFLKRSAEAQVLQSQISALEAERDEAWLHAQEVAQEMDELQATMFDAVAGSKSPSRRSSRVMASRKSSIRVSKAGLRSNTNMCRISQRMSVASQNRVSFISSAATSSFSPRDIPPVPPIPRAGPLGIITTGLSNRNSAYTSAISSTSDTRAMAQAQREICNMLGISASEIRLPRPRRSSMVASPISPQIQSPVRASRRPLSEIAGGHRSAKNMDVLEEFQDLLINDREAALAALALLDP